ncbi:MAG: putative bifunctional diguanylate cyclase/phosphodiesterase [Janthinobacterium lividum]
MDHGPVVVLDTFEDERFRNQLFAARFPHMRFYAGVPLLDTAGKLLGSLCVMGQEPKSDFGAEQEGFLSCLAALARTELTQRSLPAQLVNTQNQLTEVQERYVLATQSTSDGIWDCNCLSGEVYYSARLRSMVGLPEQDHVGVIGDWISRLHPDDAALARKNMQKMHSTGELVFESEYRIRHEDGGWRWMQNRGIALRNTSGTLSRLVGSVSDITARKARDGVTGVHTRASFLTAIDSRMRAKSGSQESYSVLVLDLDGFKRFNDSFGHGAGNCILTEVAYRIEQTLACSPVSLVARLTGDEFAILLEGISGRKSALTYAHCLQHILEAPVCCGTQEIRVSASIGIVMADASYSKAEHLLHDADLAMHQAKSSGKAQSVVFGKGLREKVVQQVTLEAELRRAIDAREFIAHYQPKVVVDTGEVIGFEALIRWNHPERGLLMPDRFIPLAEDSDLIIEVGRFILGEAIRQLVEWRNSGLVKPSTTMAVNLSAKQFTDRDLVNMVERKLVAHALPAACLELEVTEGVLIFDSSAALEVLKRMKQLGVSLALDDFGTGYSSLSYLKSYPFDSLKIDRSFIADIESNESTAAIAEAVISLGRALKLQVVAEGIETAEQAEKLRSMGCCYAQGYFYSRPLPAEHLRNVLCQRARMDVL